MLCGLKKKKNLYTLKKKKLTLKCETFWEMLTWVFKLVHSIIESPWLKVNSHSSQVHTIILTT